MRRPEDLKTTPSNEDFARLMTLAGAYIAAAIDRYKQHTRLQHTASLDDRPLPKRTCASDSPPPPQPGWQGGPYIAGAYIAACARRVQGRALDALAAGERPPETVTTADAEPSATLVAEDSPPPPPG